MDVIVERCAGLDVHRDSVVATVRVPGKGKSRRRRAQRTRTFATTIAQLEQLADWLEGFGVTLVGMEATGVYWKPVFWVLERRFECWLINAEHLHNVPGRKSDVIDSRWCCELLELGLVRPSFVPPPEIRRLRDLTRPRTPSSPRADCGRRSRSSRRRSPAASTPPTTASWSPVCSPRSTPSTTQSPPSTPASRRQPPPTPSSSSWSAPSPASSCAPRRC